MRTLVSITVLGVAALALYACNQRATLPLEAGIGPVPTLPPPHAGLLPTANEAVATSWPPGEMPVPSPTSLTKITCI